MKHPIDKNAIESLHQIVGKIRFFLQCPHCYGSEFHKAHNAHHKTPGQIWPDLTWQMYTTSMAALILVSVLALKTCKCPQILSTTKYIRTTVCTLVTITLANQKEENQVAFSNWFVAWYLSVSFICKTIRHDCESNEVTYSEVNILKALVVPSHTEYPITHYNRIKSNTLVELISHITPLHYISITNVITNMISNHLGPIKGMKYLNNCQKKKQLSTSTNIFHHQKRGF